jgi:hypothetical protein
MIMAHRETNINGNESSGFIKDGVFLDQLRDYKLLKKDCAPLIWLVTHHSAACTAAMTPTYAVAMVMPPAGSVLSISCSSQLWCCVAM